MSREEQLIRGLPDPDAARRFLGQLAENDAAASAKLLKSEGLLSDVLTLVSFSPLLGVTLLQNPAYFWWLGRKRSSTGVRGKDELLESLARFSLTNAQLDPRILFARFRRRELLRIYLRDIRRQATIAEITEEISNLADAILESALKQARREMDNRYGAPQETDDKGRTITARFCIAALGKLGSRELNYSSDIDLFFLYSNDGTTFQVPSSKFQVKEADSEPGTRDSLTNREYFAKLAGHTIKLVGSQTGEGAAYRVDVRLRPHGSLGALSLSVSDTVRYCKTEARAWERQVLIRSRGCAGEVELFKQFFNQVEDLVFSKSETVETALANVRRSKEKIDLENLGRRGFDVKLGRGGIREIEFLAQALQLAYGGRDKWLRGPHTLISLSRLADRGHIGESELTGLSNAYEFLRRTEHVMQMENGLQTHTVPEDTEKRKMLASRMAFAGGGNFERDLVRHTGNVSRIFSRIFGTAAEPPGVAGGLTQAGAVDTGLQPPATTGGSDSTRTLSHIMASIAKSDVEFPATEQNVAVLERLATVSPHFASLLAANPQLAVDLPDPEAEFVEPDYAAEMMDAASSEFKVQSSKFKVKDGESEPGTRNLELGTRLSAMRRTWSRLMLEIVVRDIFGKMTIRDAKHLQTKLAEASIAAALRVVSDELQNWNASASDWSAGGPPATTQSGVMPTVIHNLESNRERIQSDPVRAGGTPTLQSLDIAVLALGKLGGGGVDYGSDLDLIIVYFDPKTEIAGVTPAEYYGRAVELFTRVLSSMTRDGNLYRVDLRLRPFGSKGMSAISIDAFLDYMRDTAAIWEMLAFVKLRHVGGDPSLGLNVEREARRIIHERAAALDIDELKAETRRVRFALERERARPHRGGEIDIKYGPGGMLDIYFAMRFLQLRDNLPDWNAGDSPATTQSGVMPATYRDTKCNRERTQSDSPRASETLTLQSDRSTAFMLERLRANDSLSNETYADLAAGYEFLSTLDHNLRLTVGRTTRVPVANHAALATIAERMLLASTADLSEQLTLHRLAIRTAFENIVN